MDNSFKVAGINEPLINYYIYNKESAVSKSLRKNLDAIKIMIEKNRKKNYFYLLLIRNIKIILKIIVKSFQQNIKSRKNGTKST